MHKFLTLIALLASTLGSIAQTPKFSVSVSSDTVLLGNYFELKFTIENASSNGFAAPDLHEFNIIGGPNTASSMSIINGEVSQSSSYSYYLEPPDIGVFTIKPAYLTSEDVALETFPIDIIVIPNPDGIIQRPNSPGMRIDQFTIPKKPAEEVPTRPRKKF
jgi:hypothetical protein